MTQTLKDKKHKIRDIQGVNLNNFVFKYDDVKEAILNSYKNNNYWIDEIKKVLNELHLTDNQKFNLYTSLDGIENQNKIEIFGDFNK